jgi:S1-C subfamily serine protease
MKYCAALVIALSCLAASQQQSDRTQYPRQIVLGDSTPLSADKAQQSTASPQSEPSQIPIKIRVIIIDKDLNPKPVPKAKLIVKQANSPTPTHFEISTGLDGVAQATVPPGVYRLMSSRPTDFQGKSYNWDVQVTVSEAQNTFDLSNDNAAIADLVPPTNVDNLASVYKKYRDSVVTVLAEYGPAKGTGFVIDSNGLILTNQHVIHTSQWIAVQVDDSHRLAATLLASDSEKDVAVLRINPAKLPGPLSAVSLLPPGGDPAVEGERVFTIGSPLHQSKIMTTGIVSKVEKRAIISDVNINHGNSGGPLFNSQGIVIGITTFGDTSRQGGPGVSGVLRIDQARDVIAQARSKMSITPPPSADFLPNDPDDTYPLDSIKRNAQAEKFDIRPYMFGVGDYDVAIITPVVRYRHYSSEVRAARQKEKRNRKAQAAAADTFQPLDDLKGWEEYIGEYTPVIYIQASPKLKETFWSAFGRGMAASHGYVTGPASMHFKTDFYRMKLFCGTTEIQPLMPGKAERVLDVSNSAIRITDATFDGLYEYPASAITPNCGNVKLDIFSEKEPDKPKVKELDGKTVTAVYRDFEPYREQTNTTAK